MSEKSTPRLRDLLVCVATTAVLSLILTPVFSSMLASKISNKPNLKKISGAALAYGADYDQAIISVANGPYENIRGGMMGEARSDLWPLILLPYVGDRRVYQDPRRNDTNGIWSGPPKDRMEAGYSAMGNSYSNQNRFPCFGLNYIFLSPLVIESAAMGSRTVPGETKTYTQAKDPANTIFYCVSDRGYVPTSAEGDDAMQDRTRGFFVVDPPGMWGLSDENSKYLLLWDGSYCSGDWCGDASRKLPGHQRRTNYFYSEAVLGGNNIAFLDGHVKFMTDLQLTVGTDYWSAIPNGMDNGGGAKIVDKSKYLWDLNDNYYGLY